MWMLKSARSAFSSWSMVGGMIVGGIAVLNVVRRIFNIGLADAFRRLLDAYYAVFHTLFDWLTFWVPWHIPAWFKDVTVLWFVLWGAMARIIWVVYAAELRDTPHDGSLQNIVPIIGSMFREPPGAVLGFILSVFLWPLLLVRMDAHFYKWQSGGVYNLTTSNGPTEAIKRHWREQGLDADNAIGAYLFDVRLLYVIQLAMIILVAAGTVISNNIIK